MSRDVLSYIVMPSRSVFVVGWALN